MSNWDLTEGLKNLRAQVNARFPNRDKKSDGTIGDAAHQAETSGHNPDDTSGSRPEWDGDADANAEVRAWDMDSDLGEPGASAQDVVDHLRGLAGLSSVIRYMIYRRKIYRASNDWAAETYSGASAHTEHIHFTGAYSQAADGNKGFNYRLSQINAPQQEEDIMSASDAKQGIADAFAAAATATNATATDDDLWGRQFGENVNRVFDFDAAAGPLADRITGMENAIGALSVEMGAIKDMLSKMVPPATK